MSCITENEARGTIRYFADIYGDYCRKHGEEAADELFRSLKNITGQFERNLDRQGRPPSGRKAKTANARTC